MEKKYVYMIVSCLMVNFFAYALLHHKNWLFTNSVKVANSEMIGESCSNCHSADNNNIIVLVENQPYLIIEYDAKDSLLNNNMPEYKG